jgi:hypothetical protein
MTAIILADSYFFYIFNKRLVYHPVPTADSENICMMNVPLSRIFNGSLNCIVIIFRYHLKLKVGKRMKVMKTRG